MRRYHRFSLLICAGLLVATGLANPPGAEDEIGVRDLAEINWMDFKELVPAKIDTVLIPTGTLEPHGVINNGADITAPVAIARAIARRTNSMIAPVIPYGMTGSMDAYPGAFSISEAAYRAYMRDVLMGFAGTGFKTLVVINGHGGAQTNVLNEVAAEVGRTKKVRTLVVNWWSYASDVTIEVFGEDGGHAAVNETAFIQAIDPKLVHKDKYHDGLVTPNPTPGTYSAYPNPSSISQYKSGQGLVKFDQAKADRYFTKVNEKVAALILEMRRKWDLAGL